MSDQNYRAYFFANMYLPALHAGIQSQHCTAEMFVKYDTPRVCWQKTKLKVWAKGDKTTIVLNGGMSGDLQELVELFSSEDNPYPWAFFKETEYALNGALTNVGIILPEKVYTYDKVCQEIDESNKYIPFEEDCEPYPEITKYEMKIVEALRGKRLMS